MANNRLALVCKLCKEGAFLAKYYPSQGWFSGQHEDYRAYMDAFLERHTHIADFDGGDNFGIEYMSNGDFGWFNHKKETKSDTK